MRNIKPIVENLNRVRHDLLAVAGQIAPEKWQTRPLDGGWSAAEVVAHLTMVEEAIVGKAEELVQKPPRPVPLWKRWHVPPKVAEWRLLKRKTPIPLDPARLADKQTMLERFSALRARTLAFLEKSRERDLSRWRYPHPFFGSLNFYTWFKTIYHHEIRHTKQLREIIKAI